MTACAILPSGFLYRRTKGEITPDFPPMDIVRDMQTTPNLPLPIVTRIVRSGLRAGWPTQTNRAIRQPHLLRPGGGFRRARSPEQSFGGRH